MKIEGVSDTWCKLEDDSNLKWYLISKIDGKSVIYIIGEFEK